ncbi:hypothetical protein [Stenotrophomonas sp. GZD-301]|uniref:hypothetical protein n=1 Tax=Stenotrophomonas sp. GZD-301 TaxID=3404814 RepID=UPI003BB4A3B7
MDVIEMRARELLAAEYTRDGLHMVAAHLRSGRLNPELGWVRDAERAARAIIAALTPPEGYVLVPLDPTDAQLDRATWEEVGGHCSCCTAWAASHSDARRVWAAMLAARPEVG